MRNISDTKKEIYEFTNDNDRDYLLWTQENPNGYVLNSNNCENQKYSRLHRANCWTIINPDTANWTKHGHTKICSLKKSVIMDWCKERNFELDKYCQICKP